MDDPLMKILGDLGLGIGGGVVANAICGIVNYAMQHHRDVAGTAVAIQTELNSSGITMEASTIIQTLVNNGVINITQGGTITST